MNWPLSKLCQDIAARNELSKTVNFQIYPVVNTDGFNYAETVDRSWTTNRNIESCSYGINLERNFDWNFDRNQACNGPYFGGTAPESEREVRFVWKLLTFSLR